MSVVHGSCDPAFESVRAAFERCFAELGEVGASTAVYVHGRCVANLWGGEMASGVPWRQDTIVHTYSVTKAFAAVALLVLIERGQAALDDPVIHYWPEYGQAGKERTTLRHLLSHAAGLFAIQQDLPPDALLDWDRMVAAIAAEPPTWEPGTKVGEHALLYGHLVGEVVRRVSGRTLGKFLREEVCEPWAIDFHVGLLPGEEARCATVLGIEENITLPDDDLRLRAINNPPGGRSAATVNSSAYRRAEVPAINGHGSGNGVARLYAGLANGGELDGIRLLSPALVLEIASPQASSEDVYLRRHVDWGLGVQVDRDGFGMGGLGGGLGWGNLEHGFGFGYVTRYMKDHDRALAVYESAARCAGFEPVTDD